MGSMRYSPLGSERRSDLQTSSRGSRLVALMFGGLVWGANGCAHAPTAPDNHGSSNAETVQPTLDAKIPSRDSAADLARTPLGFFGRGDSPSACAAKSWLAVWNDLSGPPEEGNSSRELHVKKSGSEMEVRWVEQNLPDDSVAALGHRYFLRWQPSQGWVLQRCEKEVVRCWRGTVQNGVCP